MRENKYLQLKEGMEFKNYKELCKFLDIKPASGNTKISHVKMWERYFEWEQIGYKYKITNVYEEPIFDIRETETYTSYIQKLFLDLLYCKYMEGTKVYRITTGQLLLLLNMVNYHYKTYQNNQKELSAILDIKEKYVKDFYYTIDGKLSGTLKYALKKLSDQLYIGMQENVYMIADINHEHYLGTENEDILSCIHDVERIACEELECDCIQEIRRKGLYNEFIKICARIKREYSILDSVDYWYKVYEFSFGSKIKNKIKSLEVFLNFDKQEKREQLNRMLVDKYKESYVNKYDMSMTTIMEMNDIKYKDYIRSGVDYVESGKRLIDYTIKR